MRTYYVYIMANRRSGTLYIGMTNDLVRRTYQHREGLVPGFTARYGIKQRVHFEQTNDAKSAIAFEKRLKRWRRAWKIELIERTNPEWRDLYEDIQA